MLTAQLDLDERNGLEIRRGESPYRLPVRFQEYETLAPYNWTGCSGKSQIRDQENGLIAEFAIAFETDGWVTLTIADTSNLPPTRDARWDFWVLYPDGDKRYELQGDVVIVDRVTEP